MRVILDSFPTVAEIALLGPPSLLLGLAYLAGAARLKRRHGWRTGYTRKVFHFLVFTTAAALQWGLGLSALIVFGAAVSAVIFYAVLRGDGHPLYEAMARESDAPRRTHFILAPYLATLAGGLASNALFGATALVGYLVTGIGDAVGEPVGARLGRHRYRVPSLGGVQAFRSLEGSAAVFTVSLLAAATASELLQPPAASAGSLLLIAGVATAVEAISPHGWDNLTMQLVPAGLAAAMW